MTGKVVGKKNLTPKQLQFSQCVADGMSLSDSYRKAYKTDRMKAATIRTEACKLMVNPHVTTMVESIQARKERSITVHAVSVQDRVMDRLELYSKTAQPSDSVKVSATVWLGKTCGMFKEVTETVVNKSAAEIRSELERRLMMLDDMDQADKTLQ